MRDGCGPAKRDWDMRSWTESKHGRGCERAVCVYQVDWARAPHYNHFAQTGNGRVLGPDEL